MMFEIQRFLISNILSQFYLSSLLLLRSQFMNHLEEGKPSTLTKQSSILKRKVSSIRQFDGDSLHHTDLQQKKPTDQVIKASLNNLEEKIYKMNSKISVEIDSKEEQIIEGYRQRLKAKQQQLNRLKSVTNEQMIKEKTIERKEQLEREKKELINGNLYYDSKLGSLKKELEDGLSRKESLIKDIQFLESKKFIKPSQSHMHSPKECPNISSVNITSESIASENYVNTVLNNYSRKFNQASSLSGSGRQPKCSKQVFHCKNIHQKSIDQIDSLEEQAEVNHYDYRQKVRNYKKSKNAPHTNLVHASLANASVEKSTKNLGRVRPIEHLNKSSTCDQNEITDYNRSKNQILKDSVISEKKSQSKVSRILNDVFQDFSSRQAYLKKINKTKDPSKASNLVSPIFRQGQKQSTQNQSKVSQKFEQFLIKKNVTMRKPIEKRPPLKPKYQKKQDLKSSIALQDTSLEIIFRQAMEFHQKKSEITKQKDQEAIKIIEDYSSQQQQAKKITQESSEIDRFTDSSNQTSSPENESQSRSEINSREVDGVIEESFVPINIQNNNVSPSDLQNRNPVQKNAEKELLERKVSQKPDHHQNPEQIFPRKNPFLMSQFERRTLMDVLLGSLEFKKHLYDLIFQEGPTNQKDRSPFNILKS